MSYIVTHIINSFTSNSATWFYYFRLSLAVKVCCHAMVLVMEVVSLQTKLEMPLPWSERPTKKNFVANRKSEKVVLRIAHQCEKLNSHANSWQIQNIVTRNRKIVDLSRSFHRFRSFLSIFIKNVCQLQ